jgi:hypothetical protein
MLGPCERAAWRNWTLASGWSPTDRSPKHLPPEIATIAIDALEQFIKDRSSVAAENPHAELIDLDNANDLDAAASAIKSIQQDGY